MELRGSTVASSEGEKFLIKVGQCRAVVESVKLWFYFIFHKIIAAVQVVLVIVITVFLRKFVAHVSRTLQRRICYSRQDSWCSILDIYVGSVFLHLQRLWYLYGIGWFQASS